MCVYIYITRREREREREGERRRERPGPNWRGCADAKTHCPLRKRQRLHRITRSGHALDSASAFSKLYSAMFGDLLRAIMGLGFALLLTYVTRSFWALPLCPCLCLLLFAYVCVYTLNGNLRVTLPRRCPARPDELLVPKLRHYTKACRG